MKLVVTIFGKDQVGIIAKVSTILADNNVNIVSVNQNIVDGFFNMVMMAEAMDNKVQLPEVQKLMKAKGEELNLDIKIQNAELFTAMHRV